MRYMYVSSVTKFLLIPILFSAVSRSHTSGYFSSFAVLYSHVHVIGHIFVRPQTMNNPWTVIGYNYECGVTISLPLMQTLPGDVYIIDNF